MLKIASWNVNSIKQRASHVGDWLAEHKADFLFLQELKGLDFPSLMFEEQGYKSFAIPQKGRNGVAILYRQELESDQNPPKIILESLPGDPSDEQARYLEISYQGINLINIYAPNGNPVDSEKYPYKLDWMTRLERRITELLAQETAFIIGGDFNIIPEAKDCHNPQAWSDDALFRLETRKIFRRFIHMGLVDAYRVFDHTAEQYTFWDYQRGAWPNNHGIRIDHFLLSPGCADRLTGCRIDKEPRMREKPSDHTLIEILLD